MLDNSLLQAYEQTNYCFNKVTLNIGKPSRQAAEILEPYKSLGGLFITAWNPLGKVATDEKNQSANIKLYEDLISRNLNVIEGYGESPDKIWREDSFFAYPIDKQLSIELCMVYKQNAVVYVDNDGLPDLMINPKIG